MNKQRLYDSYKRFMNINTECDLEFLKQYENIGLTIKQLEYLYIIHKFENVTYTKIADLLEVSKPTVTEVINKFINMNLVYKEKAKHDGRIYYVRFTEYGKQMIPNEEDMFNATLKRIKACLTEEDLEMFISIMNKIK